MKKAKIMLTAITALAIVGGALAFKADKASTLTTIYTTNGGTPGVTASTPFPVEVTVGNGLQPQLNGTFVFGNQPQLIHTTTTE